LNIMDVPMSPSDDSCHYCFGASTEVVTRDGIKPIGELAGTSPQLVVPSVRNGSLMSSGTFESHPVQYFGAQPTFTVTLTRNRAVTTVITTAEHRGVTEPRSHGRWKQAEATTSTLKPGDLLKSLKRAATTEPDLMHEAAAQGFTFGDGSLPSDPE